VAELLSEDQIIEHLAELPEWGYSSATKNIFKRFEFKDFSEALAYTNKLGEAAENAGHHPDLSLGWGYVEVAFTTHDAGGITSSDVTLAQQAEALTK
jgi:4a-hydroxytetrahydrobiopterin dehydratase